MTADVTVITPSLPERAPMLTEAIASVAAQTCPPAAHLIGVDHAGRGPAEVRQELVVAAATEWVVFLDDDDLLDPAFIATLLNIAGRWCCEVVIPYCRFDGPPLPARYCNQPFDRAALADHGIFPITVLARRQSILDAGGFDPADRYEDWSLWNRMADRGCRFDVCTLPLWTYRTSHPGRRTHAA